MKLVGIGLCLIGIGIIGRTTIMAITYIDSMKKIPKGKPAGTYDDDMEWDFPNDDLRDL